MTLPKHNGWTNKPTWIVNLWLQNDEHLNASMIDLMSGLDSHDGEEERNRVAGTVIEEWFADIIPIKDGVFGDLMTWTLHHVNWEEIARNWFEE